MICTQPSESTQLYINSVLHVVILFTILGLFFMVMIAPKTRDAMQNLINGLVNGINNDSFDKINNKTRGGLCRTLKTNEFLFDFAKGEFSNTDEATQVHNDDLVKITFIIIGSLFALFTFVVLTIYFNSGVCINLVSVITENLIIFLFIAIAEYMFFINITSRYVPMVPSELSKEIIENLKNNS